MAFRFSTGAVKALLSDEVSVASQLTGATISTGSGDGTVITGTDTINDSGSGLGIFGKHDWLLIMSGDANNNIVVKALDVVIGKIEVVAGALTAIAAGSDISIIKLSGGGNLMNVLRNSVMVAFTGPRPSSADDVETGTLLATYTKDQGAFVAGASLNGLNLGPDNAGTALNRAIDPETGLLEIWQAQAVAAGTAGWVRWYGNSFTTGASASAVRIDGVVNTSGADVNMAGGTSFVLDQISNVTSVSALASGV